MFREEVIASVKRIGQSSTTAFVWFMVEPKVVEFLAKKPEGELRKAVQVLIEEADRLRRFL